MISGANREMGKINKLMVDRGAAFVVSEPGGGHANLQLTYPALTEVGGGILVQAENPVGVNFVHFALVGYWQIYVAVPTAKRNAQRSSTGSSSYTRPTHECTV